MHGSQRPELGKDEGWMRGHVAAPRSVFFTIARVLTVLFMYSIGPWLWNTHGDFKQMVRCAGCHVDPALKDHVRTWY